MHLNVNEEKVFQVSLMAKNSALSLNENSLHCHTYPQLGQCACVILLLVACKDLSVYEAVFVFLH